MENKILIKKKCLIFREDAKRIARRIKKDKCKKILVDFSKVVFMSRSFIDELLNQVENQNKEVKFLNLTPSLNKFIPKVRQTKNKIQKILSCS